MLRATWKRPVAHLLATATAPVPLNAVVDLVLSLHPGDGFAASAIAAFIRHLRVEAADQLENIPSTPDAAPTPTLF